MNKPVLNEAGVIESIYISKIMSNLSQKEYKILQRKVIEKQVELKDSLHLFGVCLTVLFPGTRFFWSEKEYPPNPEIGYPGRESFIVTSKELKIYYKLLSKSSELFNQKILLIELIQKYVDEPISELMAICEDNFYMERCDTLGITSRLFFIIDYFSTEPSKLCECFLKFKKRVVLSIFILKRIIKEEGQ